MPENAAKNELVGVTPFTIRTDVRGMTAHLDRVAGMPVADLQPEAVLEEMARQKLVITDEAQKTIIDTVAAWRANAPTASKISVAEGRPPVHGKRGEVVWADHCNPERTPATNDDDGFSHYATHLVTVKSGDVIATIQPPTPGRAGQDVYGNPIPPRVGHPAKFRLTGGCHVDEAAGTIIADVSGALHAEHEEISVTEGLHIPGNVDFNTGHVSSPGAIVIDGHVADLFNVTSGAGVTVYGDVHVTEIRADGDITIGATLASRDKGICLAGGDITVRAMETSTAVARGDVHVAREAMTSRIFAGGSIESPRATLSGGVVVARGEIVVKALGSAGLAPTIVLAGVDWMFDAQTAPILTRIEKLNDDIEKRLPAITTLKASIKRLTHAQREQVVELEFDYYTLITERDERTNRIEQLKAERDEYCNPVVKVFNTIYPGVQLRLGNRVTRIEKEMSGPITIMLTSVGNAKQIVVETGGGAKTGLKTGKLDPLHKIELPEFPPEAPPTDGAESGS